MVIFRPEHAQLRHPFLQGSISEAVWADSIWECHLRSFADLLRQVALEQKRRHPNLIVAWPPETSARPISRAPYGFALLVLRHADLGPMIPELAELPALTYPSGPKKTSVRHADLGVNSYVTVMVAWHLQRR